MTKLVTDSFPNYAAGWKEYSNLVDGTERENAINTGLELETDIETRGILLINKALLYSNKGEKEKAINILGEIILDPMSSLGNVELDRFALKSLTDNK